MCQESIDNAVILGEIRETALFIIWLVRCVICRYMSGITIPNCYYLIHAPKGGRPLQPILFMDKRSSYDELWEGSLPGESTLERTAGFVDLVPTRKLSEVC